MMLSGNILLLKRIISDTDINIIMSHIVLLKVISEKPLNLTRSRS